jgi:glycerol-1-phosphate dehydrogenase [NAD(P)+]
VQGRLRAWLADPAGVRRGDPEAVRRLTLGLLMSGLAMQRTKSSRPASGAEHQFSHLWDMQHHTHDGVAPSHGFKVGIGTLASTALYEHLLAQPLEALDVEYCCRAWPDAAAAEAEVRAAFDSAELTEGALRETTAKHVGPDELRRQLTRLWADWPGLRQRLRMQLVPFPELRSMLAAAGCPSEPEQIGIGRRRLADSYRLAYFIRRRFTVLDLARRTGLLDDGLGRLFGPAGPWPTDTAA